MSTNYMYRHLAQTDSQNSEILWALKDFGDTDKNRLCFTEEN